MKKLFLFAAVLMVAATSCKKDYTCSCDFTLATNIDIPIQNSTKSDAKDACESAETTYKIADSGVSCAIK